MTEEPKIMLVDDRAAPEFFASYLMGAAFDGPNVRLTFASAQVDHTTNSGQVNQVANVLIVISADAAKNLCDFLSSFLTARKSSAAQKPTLQ